METSSVALRPPMTHDELGTLVGQTMGLVAATAAMFAGGAYVGRNLSYGWGWLFFLAGLGCIIGLNAASPRSERLATTLLFALGALLGLSVAPTLAYYADSGSQALWQAGGSTALFIAGFGAAGYATRRDLSGLARYLLWGLFALILFGVVAIFVQIDDSSLIYALLGLVIFAGWTAFDFQRLRRTKDVREGPALAASIFLDVTNVFLLFLSLFGSGDE